MAKIALLGLGAMGSRMAQRLLAAGHDLSVWNRNDARCGPLVERGAVCADTPAVAVRDREFIISMVRDDVASRTVWLDPKDGALNAMPAHAVAIESSTLSLAWIHELAAQMQGAGVHFLDAPLSGSRPQAEAGQLIYFVGGEAAVVERCTPILKAMGSAVHHTGPAGSGSAVKLAVNALFIVQVAALAELMGLLDRAEIDLTRALEIIGSTPVCSAAARNASLSMLGSSFAPQFPLELALKDLQYAITAAASVQARLPLVTAVLPEMSAAVARGWGRDQLTGVVRLFRSPKESA